MRSPFPGANPYLEHPASWPGIHNALIGAIQTDLGLRLRPRYVARIEERTYLASSEGLYFLGRPDVTVLREHAVSGSMAGPADRASAAVLVEVPVPDMVRETWLEVRTIPEGDVVTVLEILSPTNKARSGDGRALYEKKRLSILGSMTHLVEIDLLRAGEPMFVRGGPVASDYRILVSRADRRPRAELFPFSVRESIPRFAIPLRRGDEEPLLDLKPLLEAVYEAAGYDLSIDYKSEPVPPFYGDDIRWADMLLKEAGLRPR